MLGHLQSVATWSQPSGGWLWKQLSPGSCSFGSGYSEAPAAPRAAVSRPRGCGTSCKGLWEQLSWGAGGSSESGSSPLAASRSPERARTSFPAASRSSMELPWLRKDVFRAFLLGVPRTLVEAPWRFERARVLSAASRMLRGGGSQWLRERSKRLRDSPHQLAGLTSARLQISTCQVLRLIGTA